MNLSDSQQQEIDRASQFADEAYEIWKRYAEKREDGMRVSHSLAMKKVITAIVLHARAPFLSHLDLRRVADHVLSEL